MPAKCPLCFQKLDTTQKVQRICLTHKDTRATFAFDIDKKDIFCKSKPCENPRSIQTGVFLRHVGCPATNPYWKDGQVLQVPEKDTLERGEKVFHVQHWMFAVLRELAEMEPEAPEMWFPLAMFRAVNWYALDERAGQKTGATIRLAGAISAGKTVLATMALVPNGYVQPQNTPSFRVENFVYVSPEAGSQQPQKEFLQALVPFSLMRDQRHDPKWEAPTRATRSNVKAAFFRANVEDGKLVDDIIGYFSQRTWHALLFYDTSGEDNEKPGEKHKEVVDVGAVVLDASQLGLFGQVTPPNAKTASERLGTIAANRRCLIVTKVDLVKDDLLLPAERDLIGKLRAGTDVAPGAEHAMVLRWLRDADALPAERDLAEELSGVEVFLVWTEGLNETDAGKLPRTLGMRKFVSWCLAGRFAPKKPRGK